MSYIKIEVPNDDHIALRAFGKALEEMALAHGAEPKQRGIWVDQQFNIHPTADAALAARLRKATETLQKAAPRMMQEARFDGEELQGERKEPEVDTTAQQVESLAERADVMLEVAEQPFQGEVVPTTDSTGTPWDERIHSASKALNADGTWRLRRKPKDMDEAEWATFVETVKTELSEGLETPAEAYLTDDFVKPSVTHQNPVYMYQESRNVYALGRSEEEIAEYETKGYVRHTQEQYDAWEGPTVADEGDDFHTDADVVTEQTVAGIPPLPVPPPVVVAPPVPVQAALSEGIARYGDAMSELAKNDGDVQWDFPRLMTFLTERHGKIDVATVNTLLAQDGMSSVQELNANPDKIGPFVARVKAHLGEL